MFVDDATYRRNGKTYRRVLLREDYVDNGKYKKRTIANLTNCSDNEIEATKIALKNKNKIPFLKQITEGIAETGKSVGAIFVLFTLIIRMGIFKALGKSKMVALVVWLIIARIIDKGSRLSAVRIAQHHAVCEIVNTGFFNEDNLYSALDWLCENKNTIEKRLFSTWQKNNNKLEKARHKKD